MQRERGARGCGAQGGLSAHQHVVVRPEQPVLEQRADELDDFDHADTGRDGARTCGDEAEGQVAMMRWRALLAWLSSHDTELQLRKDSASWVTIGNAGVGETERQLDQMSRHRQGRRCRTSPSNGKHADDFLDAHPPSSARCMPRVVVALTQSGSLVGVCAIERSSS